MRARIIPLQRCASDNFTILPASLLKAKGNSDMSANEIVVLGYMLSLYSNYEGVQVTQQCIAEHSSLCVRTVKNIIDKFYRMGYIDVIQNAWDGKKKKRETNVYILKNSLLDSSRGFFYVPRSIFNMKLSPKVLLVYFFMCHSQNYEYDKSWNSYSDISKKLKLNRGEVIKLVAELENIGLVSKKHKIISKSGKGNCYADNRYSVSWLSSFIEKVENSIKRKPALSYNNKNVKNMINTFWNNFEKNIYRINA